MQLLSLHTEIRYFRNSINRFSVTYKQFVALILKGGKKKTQQTTHNNHPPTKLVKG